MNHLIHITFVSVISVITFAIVYALTWPLIKTFRHLFCVPEGQAGLLYRHGLYVRRSNAGHRVVWGRGWRMTLVDLRKTSLLVAGQEVLTADNVGLKASLLVICRVTDPAKALHETQNWQRDIDHGAQLALRVIAGKATVEALLKQRMEMGAQLLTRVQPEAARIGVSVIAIEVKDVTLPADLKRAFAEVLKARHPGLAALERARGESAVLKNGAPGAKIETNRLNPP
jgi:regulator of protease activity HflC (stomatin/prohibitin superfamily)